MKNNKRTIFSATALVLLFSVLLSVCMVVLSCKQEPDKDASEETSIMQPSELQTQQMLYEKFAKYTSEETQNGKKIAVLFNEEQREDAISKLNSGKRFYLTQQEAMFIINDSVRLYEENDTVVFEGYSRLPFVQAELEDQKLFASDDEGEASVPDSVSIDCYHGDFSEFPYKAAADKYYEMLGDIYDIISYRFAMHDSRFLTAFVNSGMFSGLYGYSRTFSFDPSEFQYENGDGSKGKLWHAGVRVLMTDNGVTESIEDYKTELASLFDYTYVGEYDESYEDMKEYVQAKYPVFLFRTGESYGYADTVEKVQEEPYSIRLHTGRHEYETVFPTKELKEKYPELRWDTSCIEISRDYQVVMSLPGGEQRFSTADGRELRKLIHVFNQGTNGEAIETQVELGELMGVFAHLSTNYDRSVMIPKDELYFSVDLGYETRLCKRPDGAGYIEQTHGDKTWVYKLGNDDWYESGFTDLMWRCFTVCLTEMYAQGLKGFPNGTTASMQSMLGLDEYYEDNGIFTTCEIPYSGEYEFNNYFYGDMVCRYGHAYTVPEMKDRYLYYTNRGVALTFALDKNNRIIDCCYEDAYYIRYFTVTDFEKTENGGIIYADGDHGKKYVISHEDTWLELEIGSQGFVAFKYALADADVEKTYNMPSKMEVDALCLKIIG